VGLLALVRGLSFGWSVLNRKSHFLKICPSPPTHPPTRLNQEVCSTLTSNFVSSSLHYYHKTGKSTSVAKCFFHSYTSNCLTCGCCISAQWYSWMMILIFSPRKMSCSNVQKINKRCQMANSSPNGVSGHLQCSKKNETFLSCTNYACNNILCDFRVENHHIVMRET